MLDGFHQQVKGVLRVRLDKLELRELSPRVSSIPLGRASIPALGVMGLRPQPSG
jgi:hypothetical protein